MVCVRGIFLVRLRGIYLVWLRGIFLVWLRGIFLVWLRGIFLVRYIVRLSRNVLGLACCSAAVIYGGGPSTTGLCG